MIKQLLGLFFMLSGLISPSVVSAQQFLQHVSETAALPSYKSAEGQRLRSLQADCSSDDVNYVLAKNLNPDTYSAFNVLGSSSSNIGGASQWFDAPQSITIRGVRILTRALTVSTTLNVSVHNATSEKTPGMMLINSTVISPLGNDPEWVDVIFSFPVTVTGPYVISVQNPSSTSSINLYTNFNSEDMPSGRGEQLARVFYSSMWYNPTDLYHLFDADFIFIPLVGYNTVTDFTYAPLTPCSGETVELTNTSSPILQNRFYNPNKFYDYFDEETDDTFEWTLADGSSTTTTNTSTTSNTSGAASVLLTSSYTNWTGNTCTKEKSANINFTERDDASFSYGAESFCIEEGLSIIADITGLSGGIFSSAPGLVFEDNATGKINVDQSVPATYTITYTTNGLCPNVFTQDVIINELPIVTLEETTVNLCVNSGIYILTGGIPEGGIYTLNGVPATSLQASPDVLGIHDIIYAYTDPVTGCTANTNGTIEVDICTGISKIPDLTFAKVFPNPTMGIVTIESSADASIEVLNAQGIVILSAHTNKNATTTLDLENQTDGIYFVRVLSQSGIATHKVNLVK